MKFLARQRAFTLLEVVLAVGVLALALISLAGLLARSSQNLSEAFSQNKAEALAGKLDAFLREKEFNEVYSWIAGDSQKVLFFYSFQPDPDLEKWDLMLRETDFTGLRDEISRSRGPLLKIILKSSPLSFQETGENEVAPTLPASPDDYAEGYLPVEAWVYSVSALGPEPDLDPGPAARPDDLITVYTYAVTRAGSL